MQLKPYGYAPVPGMFFFVPGVLGIYLFFVMGLVNLVTAYHQVTDSKVRNQYLYITIGLVCSLVGGVFDLLPVLGLPVYPGAIIGNTLFAVLATMAIVRYHLLDIRIIIRKSLAYFLISATIAVPYVSILVLLNQVLKTKIESWWVHALIILLLAIFLRPLYSRTQRFVDKLFYGERYDYLRTLQQFGQQAHSVDNLDELGFRLVQLVMGALQASSACLLLKSESENAFVIKSFTGLSGSPPSKAFDASSAIIKWLTFNRTILHAEKLDVVPQLQSLPATEKNVVQWMNARLFVPIMTREEVVSGILTLGRNISGQGYSGEDERLLMTLSSQMAVALENARLYEESIRSREALQQSEKKYREVAESITDMFFAMDHDSSYIYWNRACEEITGIAAKDILGKHLGEMFPKTEAISQTKQVLLQVLKTKKAQQFSDRYISDGKDLDLEFNVYPAVDGLVVFAKNVTEQRWAQKKQEQLQKELDLTSRLVSIGELAAGVAHEINNPLTGIIGFSERLLRKTTEPSVTRDIETIYNEAQRAASVVQNLLTFARRRDSKKEFANLNDILLKTLELRAYELRTSNIVVTTNLARDLPRTMVDCQQIQEVFLNLILNAEQAIRESKQKGSLNIRTVQIDGYVKVSFTDDGSGISDENLNKLFTPFFTTRAERGGTGLGLSICYGIVTKHGGRIYAESKVGTGTIIFVELPLKDESKP